MAHPKEISNVWVAALGLYCWHCQGVRVASQATLQKTHLRRSFYAVNWYQLTALCINRTVKNAQE